MNKRIINYVVKSWLWSKPRLQKGLARADRVIRKVSSYTYTFLLSFARKAGKLLAPIGLFIQRTWLYKSAAAYYHKHPVFENWRLKLRTWGKNHPYQVTTVLTVLLILLISFMYNPVKASTAILVPNLDNVAVWNPSTGVGTDHYPTVDEGLADDTNDYVEVPSTDTSTFGEEYYLADQPNIASASQIVVRIYMRSTLVQSTADTLSLNLRINSTLQTATTCNPTLNTWTACTATYSGSWTQSDIDSMRVVFTRNILGTGPSSSRPDTLQVSNVYGTLTYVAAISYNQASYRFFNNQDASTTPTFAKAYGKSTAETLTNAIKTADGGYASIGSSSTGPWLAKYGPAGNIIWSTQWSLTGTARGIAQTSDGGFIVTGNTSTGSAGAQDMILEKFDSAGNLSWHKYWGSTGNDYGFSVIQTSDGGYAVTGQTVSYGDTTNGDMFVAKYDSSGTLSWSRTWGRTGVDGGEAIIQTSDGGYAVTGSSGTAAPLSTNDVILVKYDSSGTLSWNVTWGGGAGDFGRALIQTSDGGYMVTGSATLGSGLNDLFIVKYDSAGAVSWNKLWGGSLNDEGKSVIQTSDGGYAIGGLTANFGGGSDDALLIKYDSSGNVSWNQTFGGSSSDSGLSILQTSDGGYVMGGQTSSFGAGSSDDLLVRYDSGGSVSGCATYCSSPSATTSSPSATTSSPSATTSSPSATNSGGIPTDSNLSVTTTSVVSTSPTIDVGSTLATQDTAATIAGEGQPIRLRLNLATTLGDLSAGQQNFKLQYATRSGTCDTAFSGETYVDVTDSSTISYYNNTTAVSSLELTTNANDPTDGGNTLVRQTYQEAGTTTFTSTVDMVAGNDGMWDFALTTSGATQNTHYCLRVIKSDGSTLTTYSQIPEIITPAATQNQVAFRWFNNGTATVADSDNFSAIGDGPTTNCSATDGTYVYICGYDTVPGNNQWRIERRLISDGSLAPGWGDSGSGIIQDNIGSFSDQAAGIAIDSTYMYVVGASAIASGNQSMVVEKRNLNDGSLVTGWQSGGVMQQNPSTTNDVWLTIAIDSTYMYLGGYDQVSTNPEWRIEKHQLSDGAIVNGFGNSGVVSYNPTTTNDQLSHMVIDSTSMYVIGYGSPTGQEWIIQKRNLSNGNTDGVFGSGTGIIVEDVAAGNDIPSSIALKDGNLYIGGGDATQGTTDIEWRLEKRSATTGNLDGTFGSNTGVVTANPSSTNETIVSIAVDSNYIYAAGHDTTNTNAQTRLQKFDAVTGNSVTGFGTSGVITQNLSSGNDIYYGIQLSGGYILLSGIDITSGNQGWRYERRNASNGALDPGLSALAANNTAVTMTALNTSYRLRVLISLGSSGLAAGGQTYKLQYAAKSGSCSATSGGSYADVTTLTPIAYDSTAINTDGTSLGTNSADPTDGSNTNIPENYVGSNNFSNTQTGVSAGQDGEWEFALKNTLMNASYCLRVVKSDGSLLDTYTQFPELNPDNVYPNAPTLTSPSDGATSQSTSPTFTFSATDNDGDDLYYIMTIYQSDCTTEVYIADQTENGTGWSSATPYASGATATYTYTGPLNSNTTYCWKAAALDPNGANGWGADSATRTFTTQFVGTTIKGGTIIKRGIIQ